MVLKIVLYIVSMRLSNHFINVDLLNAECVLLISHNVYYFFQTFQMSFALTSRFKAVHKYNSNIKILNQIKKPLKFEGLGSLNILQTAKLFHKLCDAIEIMNKTFTIHLAFYFPVMMVSLSISSELFQLNSINFSSFWYFLLLTQFLLSSEKTLQTLSHQFS